jgi:hypothetical protein
LSGVQQLHVTTNNHVREEKNDQSYDFARENAHKCINCTAGFPDKNRLFLHYKHFPSHDIRPDVIRPTTNSQNQPMPLQVMAAKIESRLREEQQQDNNIQ